MANSKKKLSMNRVEFIKKCSLLNITEKRAAEMYNKAIGKINASTAANAGKMSPAKVVTPPKLDYSADTVKAIDTVKKAAFNLGFQDAIKFVMNGR